MPLNALDTRLDSDLWQWRRLIHHHVYAMTLVSTCLAIASLELPKRFRDRVGEHSYRSFPGPVCRSCGHVFRGLAGRYRDLHGWGAIASFINQTRFGILAKSVDQPRR
ncbi:hypothetical protein Pan258_58200 [Symmachiella dynata]|nr:hypothetical protein Pan258_58200 [Symmachiella dynata]